MSKITVNQLITSIIKIRFYCLSIHFLKRRDTNNKKSGSMGGIQSRNILLSPT